MNNQVEVDDEIDLLEILEIIKEKFFLFLTIGILCCTSAYLITHFLIKEEFTATAKMIVVQKSDSSSQQSSYTYSDSQISQKLVSTYSQIIMSEAISDQVISELDLFNKYEIDSKAYNNIVTVSAANNTEVFNIEVVTNDPELSADIANKVAEVFKDKIYDIMQIENVTTLTEAKVPTQKSGPSTMKNMLIGAAIGVVICGIIGLITLLTDKKVKTEEDVKKIFDYPIIGTIPEIDIKEKESDDYDN